VVCLVPPSGSAAISDGALGASGRNGCKTAPKFDPTEAGIIPLTFFGNFPYRWGCPLDAMNDPSNFNILKSLST
jgi:hypothetical protein